MPQVSTIDLPVSKEELCSFDFDTLSLTHDQLVPCAMYMFENMHLLTEFNIDPVVFKVWINKIKGKYNVEPTYHNWWHGIDVLHTTFRLMACAQAESYLSKLEIFSTMVAATGHDVGHPGVNNAFLVKSKNELALKYNDKSPLENMHCATLYEVAGQQDADIFGTLTDEQWHDCRKQIVECILNTDMVNHFGNVGKLQNFFEVSGVEVSNFVNAVASGAADVAVPEVFTDAVEGPKNRLLLQETFLHAADLSNPVKPLAVYQKMGAQSHRGVLFAGRKGAIGGLPGQRDDGSRNHQHPEHAGRLHRLHHCAVVHVPLPVLPRRHGHRGRQPCQQPSLLPRRGAGGQGQGGHDYSGGRGEVRNSEG